ncbi:MAG: DUF1684 domain-containing protein [Euryarchaeota archaeon]|nr:DUF1684 domain-containing protein [Euryarchaeota archaeon]
MTFTESEILSYRREKDEAFTNERDSPIPAPLRSRFSGLNYYAPDKRYYVATKLVPATEEKWVTMTTSDGDERRMLVAGVFEFPLEQAKVRLTAYRHGADDDHVFIPFRDATAPKETYGAGRYLDVPHRPNQLIFLDLNYAYNPYCAYSDDYSCPFPPRENWIDVPIRAGEKNWEKPVAEEPTSAEPSRLAGQR